LPVRNHDKEIDLYLKELDRLFSKSSIIKIAKEKFFMQRETKFTPEKFLALCAFVGEDLGINSLPELCGQLQGALDLQITSEGLNQRFNQCSVEFLKEVFQQMLMEQVVHSLPIVEQRIFNRIRILDATSFDLPAEYADYQGPNGTGVKAQVEWELYSGSLYHLAIQHGKASDSKYAAAIMDDIQPGDLVLRDLGYLSQKNLLDIARNGGYYISRLKSNTKLYQKNDVGDWEEIDKNSIREGLEAGETTELTDVRVGAKQKNPLITRVVITKLTKEQEENRQAHLNIKKGKGKKSLSAQQNISINIFATNIPQTMVDKQEIYPLYSLRWQIEIIFKTWKSLFGIQEVKKMKKERFECHLYGTLIQLILCSTIAFQCRRFLYQKHQMEVSEYKAIEIALACLTSFKLTFQRGDVKKLFQRIRQSVETNGRKCHRQQRRTVFDILHIGYRQCVKAA
jgi:hypothetical protein